MSDECTHADAIRDVIPSALGCTECLKFAREALMRWCEANGVELPSVDHAARKPRVLKALSPAPAGNEESRAPVDSEQRIRPTIPKSRFARIRTWVEYGQVAAVYGVAVDVIEGILRQT
jgi:hypothetical protein